MRIFFIYMAALKWTYPRFGSHGSALGFWKLDILHENPEILNFRLWLQACCDLLNIRIWRWSLDTYLYPIMSAFHLNLNQLNWIIESKVMVEIPIYVWARIQIRIWVLDNSGFFHLWSTSNRFKSPYLAEFEISWFSSIY